MDYDDDIKKIIPRGQSAADELWKVVENKHMDKVTHLADTDKTIVGLLAKLVVFEILKRKIERNKDGLDKLDE